MPATGTTASSDFEVITTILDTSIDCGQIGTLYEAKVARGARYPHDQVSHADGRPAVHDARDGPQGDLGPRVGVQSDPHIDDRRDCCTNEAPRPEAEVSGRPPEGAGSVR